MKSGSVNQTVELLTGSSVYQTNVSSRRQARATPADFVVKINQWMNMNVRNSHCQAHKVFRDQLDLVTILSEGMVSL
jgi:hypothetical protein